MYQYLDLVANVLGAGRHKPNRTGVDTISGFSKHYTIDLQEDFPLLTTKGLSGFRWNSLIHELLWYLSDEEHIRILREETGIWDAWADEKGHLDTTYDRFWQRYPVPEEGLTGEVWPDDGHRWTNDEGTFDQLAYVFDTLDENPNSRQLVINAWHPANAAVSTLPPCHYTFVFNVQGDELNLHLAQRSGDIVLDVLFNLAAYAILAQVVAQRAGFELGSFAHTIADAHVYCGASGCGAWYGDHLDELQFRLADAQSLNKYLDVREWLLDAAPEETDGEEGCNHVSGLPLQASREPRKRPVLDVTGVPLEDLSFEDIVLRDYDPADGIRFAVAE